MIKKAPLALLLLAGVLAGCSSLDRINPFSGNGGKLPELAPLPVSNALAVAWRVDLGETGDYGFTPAVAGRQVCALTRAGVLACFEDGRQLWRRDLGVRLSGSVGSDGQIVVVTTAQGEAWAMAAEDGRELWRSRLGSEVIAPPVIGEGKVFLRGNDGRLFAVDASDGKRRWVYQRNLPPLTLRSISGLVLDDGRLYAGFPGGKLVALDAATGASIWESTVATPKGTTELERVADVTGTPLLNSRAVCAVAWQGRTACFDRRVGALLWARELSSSVGAAMADSQLVIVDDKGAVLAIDAANGASLWRQEALVGRHLGRPLLLAEHVALSDAQGLVHLMNRNDGALVGRLATDGVVGELVGLTLDGQGFVVQTRRAGLLAVSVR